MFDMLAHELLADELRVARHRLNNINIDVLEFIQVHCADTLIELSIASFDREMAWTTEQADIIHQHGNAISGFRQLKALDVLCFSCNHLCFEILLRVIQENMQSLEAIDISQNHINLASGNIMRDMLINGNILRLDMNYIRPVVSRSDAEPFVAGSIIHDMPDPPYESLPILSIIQGCCQSQTVGIVKMKYVYGYDNILYNVKEYVVQKFKSGHLRLFEFAFGEDELTVEQETKILECRKRNMEWWTNARKLQANKVSTRDMYDVISSISWDTSLIKDAMACNTNGMLFFIVDNKKYLRELR
jgi:hypothetical protein